MIFCQNPNDLIECCFDKILYNRLILTFQNMAWWNRKWCEKWTLMKTMLQLWTINVKTLHFNMLKHSFSIRYVITILWWQWHKNCSQDMVTVEWQTRSIERLYLGYCNRYDFSPFLSQIKHALPCLILLFSLSLVTTRLAESNITTTLIAALVKEDSHHPGLLLFFVFCNKNQSRWTYEITVFL